MKADGSDWINKPEKNEVEKLFDSLLFYRQLASLSVERLRIVKELEQLLPEDQTKFVEYLSESICQYEKECEAVLDLSEDDPGPIPEKYQDVYYDKNTTLVQYLYSKRIYILAYLQEIKAFWNSEQLEKIAIELKEAHGKDISGILNAKKRIENDFPLLENITMKAIKDSPDTQKNELLKKSLEEMRLDFQKNGFNV